MQLACLLLFLAAGTAAQTFSSPKIDSKELKCLVCQATIDEFDKVYNALDPHKTVEIGGYSLDGKGNMKQKKVPQAKSETHLSEMLEKVCNIMDDYVRATYKTNGRLTLLKLIGSDGKMNSDMSKVDIVQDDDLNKSLKYYCETVLEEQEENIIKHYLDGSSDIDIRVCSQDAGYCDHILPENEYQHDEM